MAITFEGFPRVLERAALKPGRWFVAGDGLRPVLGLVTDVEHQDDLLAITFGAPRVEQIEIFAIPIGNLVAPFGTAEDDVVFSPGLGDRRPSLVAPVRRGVRHGALVRLRSGDLGISFATPSGQLAVVSLTTGMRSEGFELVFERWSLSLRRGTQETLLGFAKPSARLEGEWARLK